MHYSQKMRDKNIEKISIFILFSIPMVKKGFKMGYFTC